MNLWENNISGEYCLKYVVRLYDHHLFISVKEIASDRLKAIRSCVEDIPKPHMDTARALFKHLTQ